MITVTVTVDGDLVRLLLKTEDALQMSFKKKIITNNTPLYKGGFSIVF